MMRSISEACQIQLCWILLQISFAVTTGNAIRSTAAQATSPDFSRTQVWMRRTTETTRKWWVLDVLKNLQPNDIERVILRLVDLKTYKGDKQLLRLAKTSMDDILAMDGFGVGYVGHTPVILRAAQMDLGEFFESSGESPNADEFLKQQFSEDIQVDELGLDPSLTENLQGRIDEVKSAPTDNMPLACIFLLGSTLEGLLLAVALKDPSAFGAAKAAPKDGRGKTKKLYDWKLAELINVSHELDVLSLDVKRFSHELRDFRNFIHPYQQVSLRFSPDQNTVDICWHVFKAAFSQLKKHTSEST